MPVKHKHLIAIDASRPSEWLSHYWGIRRFWEKIEALAVPYVILDTEGDNTIGMGNTIYRGRIFGL